MRTVDDDALWTEERDYGTNAIHRELVTLLVMMTGTQLIFTLSLSGMYSALFDSGGPTEQLSLEPAVVCGTLWDAAPAFVTRRGPSGGWVCHFGGQTGSVQ